MAADPKSTVTTLVLKQVWWIMRTGRRSFKVLLPESSKIFKLNVYFDSQITTSLWDIYVFYQLINSYNIIFHYVTEYQNKCVTKSRVKKKAFKFSIVVLFNARSHHFDQVLLYSIVAEDNLNIADWISYYKEFKQCTVFL